MQESPLILNDWVALENKNRNWKRAYSQRTDVQFLEYIRHFSEVSHINIMFA